MKNRKRNSYPKPVRCGVHEGNLYGLNNLYRLAGLDINNLSRTRPWTRDCQEYLVELYELGWTIEKMAMELNRTPGSVVGKLYDLGEAGKLRFGCGGRKVKMGSVRKTARSQERGL